MIRTHDDPSILTVDVAGPATMMESPAVASLANERIASGVRAVRIDLRDCTTMDSTFSGTLLALERQLGRLGGSLTLVSPSERVVELLEQMGVDDFYAIELSERGDGPWVVAPLARPRTTILERVVFDAHDELSHLPIPQADAFRAVCDELCRTPDIPAVPPSVTHKRRVDDEPPESLKAAAIEYGTFLG
jgi:anti-anti-sigma factor